MSRELVRLFALLTLACAHAQDAGSHPAPPAARAQAPTCRRDQSGIVWALPFEAARAKAATERRLLFLKPIAFGTSADGGW